MAHTVPLPRTFRPSPDLWRSEWTKLRSVRSTLWTVLAFFLASVGSAVLVAHATAAGWASTSPADRLQTVHDPVGTLFSGAGFGLILVCVLGTLVATGEFSSGTISTSVLAVPRRTPLLVAKAGTLTALLLAVGTATGVVALSVGAAFLPHQVVITPGMPGVVRQTIGFGLYTAVLGLFSFALGTLIRHTAGALTASIGMLLVVGPLSTTLPGYLGNLMPTTAGQLIVQGDGAGTLSPWAGFAVFLLWTAGLLLAAGSSFRQRSVA